MIKKSIVQIISIFFVFLITLIFYFHISKYYVSNHFTYDSLINKETIKFGKFMFGGPGLHNSYGEELEWLVLDEDINTKLIISKYALLLFPIDVAENKNISWDNSFLKYYLNNDFINTFFTKDERNKIVPINNGLVTILNNDELNNYFDEDKERKTYALGLERMAINVYGIDNYTYVWYWSRSNGYAKNDFSVVEPTGEINNYGYKYNTSDIWVRPVIRIKK